MTGPRIDLLFLLNQSAHAFAAQFGDALAGVGLSVREYCVLLKAAEGTYTQNAVAEMAMLDKTTMVTTLDNLERRGLAERRVSDTDRRARIVALTRAGEEALEEASKTYNATVAKALEGLAPSEGEAFVEALQRLVEGPWATPSHTMTLRRRAPASAR
ncbi:MarR family winged helix-turn-helix transcriptional regulator [Nocardioides albus]|uniref:DNA-binding MarR family transcriptional regulator n=1 Tax=Nocardioides albus TaxID=1841 RepID=A0A7W5F739_9ACTN|nr:MarR family winged helix-turn-helix transcriptional regulator [Nocardioides albus]MBB3087596.1 DNA-binding MarR family transcriptional regulator [Nocardioides albus]GGU10147.1 MarR family transcriptional regulator [Nocardioides albus]